MTSRCLQDDRAFREHSESTQNVLREHSEGTQRILKEHLERNQREREQSDFVIPSEPKILRLVILNKNKEYFEIFLEKLW